MTKWRKYIYIAGGALLLGSLYEFKRSNHTLNELFDTRIIDYFRMTASKSPENTFIRVHFPDEDIFIDNVKHSLALYYSQRLLGVAHSNIREYRLKAIQSLATLPHLTDSDYIHIAQMCDASVAIALARVGNVDERFFLDATPTSGPRTLMKSLKKLMVNLERRSKHACLNYCLGKTFQDKLAIIDDDSTYVELNKELRATNSLRECVKCILHHSQTKDYARDIVQEGGLIVLHEIYRRFHNMQDITITIAKIIANISQYPQFVHDLHHTRWIKILVTWTKDGDLRLAATAAQALANLDRDFNDRETFTRNIFNLYPSARQRGEPSVDVVLVHGLLGGVFHTWRQRDSLRDRGGVLEKLNYPIQSLNGAAARQYLDEIANEKHFANDFELVVSDCPELAKRDVLNSLTTPDSPECVRHHMESDFLPTQCWPRDWLAQDCPRMRLVGVNYESNISEWSPKCPQTSGKQTMDKRSEEMLTDLSDAGVGRRPIVWIAHSMGGLFVKNILWKAANSNDPNLRAIFERTKAVVFYSTPHFGAKIAAFKQTTSFFIWPSMEVRELRENSPALLKLNENFKRLLTKNRMNVISFAESRPTYIAALRMTYQMVEPKSADPGFGEFYQIPQDHLSICKPENRQSFLYQKVLKLIEQIIDGKIIDGD